MKEALPKNLRKKFKAEAIKSLLHLSVVYVCLYIYVINVRFFLPPDGMVKIKSSV